MNNNSRPLRLSIIMPVYNEHKTLEEIVQRVRDVELSCQVDITNSRLITTADRDSRTESSSTPETHQNDATLSHTPNVEEKRADNPQYVDLEREIIIVDDGSTDGTREILDRWRQDLPSDMRIIYHQKNGGKGAALRTGFQHATGDFIVIQDADLEYDPRDYFKLIEPILEGRTDVVYGSRFLGGPRSAMSLSHMLGNRILTIITNLLYGTFLSDMETCYKCFSREVVQGMKLKSRRFEIEPELTAKILRRGYNIFEVPIRYHGRDFHDGKKISWRDGFAALIALIKYRFIE